MRVWVITVGEPLPTDPHRGWLSRSGMLCNVLADRGHEVVWWSSTFDHARKVHRFLGRRDLEVRAGLQIRLLHSIGYVRNVSLRRLVNHWVIGRQFAQEISRETVRPDVMLVSMPTIELCEKAVEYGNQHGIPIAVDLRDMWPDIFLDPLPNVVRSLARLVLAPMYSAVRKACRGADGILGISAEFVQWGLECAGRPIGKADRHFWLGYEPPDRKQDDTDVERELEAKGVSLSDGEPMACFFGVMSGKLEIETVIEAAKILQEKKVPMKFVLCGTGENLERYRKFASTCENVFFPGWVVKAEIHALMKRSMVGLAPYRSRQDFRMSIPTKAIEYLAGGLPIVSSLTGTLQNLLSKENCGVTYRNGDASELALILESLIADQVGLSRMAAKARGVYETCFRAERVYAEMADHVEAMAREGEK